MPVVGDCERVDVHVAEDASDKVACRVVDGSQTRLGGTAGLE